MLCRGSLLICFQFVIDNNWNDIMYSLKVKHSFLGPFYCVSFFVTTNFVMYNAH